MYFFFSLQSYYSELADAMSVLFFFFVHSAKDQRLYRDSPDSNLNRPELSRAFKKHGHETCAVDDHSRNKSRTAITLAKDNYLDTGSRSYYGLQDQSLGASSILVVIKPRDGATNTKQTSKKT